MLTRLFTEHPASVDETYTEHMALALGFSGRMFSGACACLLHAFMPFLCLKTCSGIIDELHTRMVTNRSVQPEGHLAGRAALHGAD